VVLGLVIVSRRWKGQPVFSDRDWRFLFGHAREKVFTARLWLRFAALWLTVVLVGLGIVFYVIAASSGMVSCRGAAWHSGYFGD
jgi:hypothetical protein